MGSLLTRARFLEICQQLCACGEPKLFAVLVPTAAEALVAALLLADRQASALLPAAA